MNLFTSKTCSVCGKEFAPDKKNPQLTDGFQDQDTGELVHWSCRKQHYFYKHKKGMGGLYSEVPLVQ